MTLYIHEWKQNFKTLVIWATIIAGMTFIFMMIFPQMEGQMDEMADVYANLGGFSQAFGMDRISFTTPMGFYGIEAGAMIAIGGGMFAALAGGGIVCKEEGAHTADFLFTMPKKRTWVLLQKLLAAVTVIIVFNAVCLLSGIAAFACIGEPPEWKEFLLYHLAQCCMQLQVGLICFGISAFMKKVSLGVAIGIAMLFYFAQMFVNISDSMEWLKYFTPYYYADAANIFPEGTIMWGYLIWGFVYSIAAAGAGIFYFSRKDLRA